MSFDWAFSSFTFKVIIERHGFSAICVICRFHIRCDVSISLWSLLPSTLRVLLMIFCRAVLVVPNSFSFCLSGKVVISPSIMNGTLLEKNDSWLSISTIQHNGYFCPATFHWTGLLLHLCVYSCRLRTICS